MFKNWFRSTNEKRMEEQIAQLKEDVKVLQTKLSLLEKRDELIVTTVDEVSNVLEPRSEVVSNVVEVSDVLELEESPTVEENPKVVDVVTPIIEEEHKVVVEEKAFEPIAEEKPNVVEVVAEAKTIEEPKVVAEEKVSAEEKPTVVDVVTPIAEEEPKIVAEEKVFKPIVKEEKETTPAPKKRRQSKKAAQLEESLPK